MSGEEQSGARAESRMAGGERPRGSGGFWVSDEVVDRPGSSTKVKLGD